MNNTLKIKLIETAKELQPLIDQLPQNNGRNNYITYYEILLNIGSEDMRKFTALALMQCKNINIQGLYDAMNILIPRNI